MIPAGCGRGQKDGAGLCKERAGQGRVWAGPVNDEAAVGGAGHLGGVADRGDWLWGVALVWWAWPTRHGAGLPHLPWALASMSLEPLQAHLLLPVPVL